jgi:hypothetical protein
VGYSKWPNGTQEGSYFGWGQTRLTATDHRPYIATIYSPDAVRPTGVRSRQRRRLLPFEFGETMYVPLVTFAVFASILFGIGLVAGRAADRIRLLEEKKRKQSAA